MADASPQSPSVNLLSATLSSASSLVFLQFFSRIFTFALNQALVRLASPQTFGTAAIQFELLLSTILFLSREGVRNALLRAPPSVSSNKKGLRDLLTNISLLPVFLGIPAAFIIASIYTVASAPSTAAQPHFHLSVVIYAVAASLELLAEPLHIRAQNELRFSVRVRAEGASVLLKTLVTFAVLAFGPPDWALLAFALGQAAYGSTTLVSFLLVYGRQSRYLLKTVSMEVVYFDPELLHLSRAMTVQSAVKHFLTEGDKFFVSRLSPLADQGGYAIASNYGSLVARILFQPIEETSRLFFSKTLPTSSDKGEAKAKDAIHTAARILLGLLLLFTHLLLLLSTFGPPYLALATTVFLPPRYQQTSAPIILRAYIYYIPTMAFNGVLEAFLASACTPADLRAQSRWMAGASVGFVLAAVGLARGLGWGDAGLVYANIANLGVRALYAWLFVGRYFRARGAGSVVGWRGAVPPKRVLVVFALAAGVTRWSERVYRDVPLSIIAQSGHVAVGGVCAVGCLLACFFFEKAKIAEVSAVLRRR
ncbi:multidrug flippase [Heterobasidion irregulare TC 32-1]|uniref:Man(5)GlcNAc(2)-PP-dolichol translocation protein RFT1 n=1 Tax=Heterobasidion irregulare (strain TC 32-1) TaxID=747525 RepID=W4K7Y7_HETIT|nr:multidrug flippase [Heterobasidion irregulare TC 32-1]ETW81859.1 multidrug flippase [Heterobasidion irregulare TC 32-1]